MPTLAGFQSWIVLYMQIGTGYLPTSSVYITNAYTAAINIVNDSIALVSPQSYSDAVYNLAGDLLINYAQDVSVTNSTITWSNGVATVTTSAAHGFSTGDTIAITGAIPSGYCLTGQISVTGTFAYTLPIVTNPGTCTTAGISTETFFLNLRTAWKINSFVPGVIASDSDESTSNSLLNPEFMKMFTMGDLQRLKTPWGRQYLQIAMDYGSIVGSN
jgi:hypothetical protein